jgi:hypothetical protein
VSIEAEDRTTALAAAQQLSSQAKLLAARFPHDPQRDVYLSMAADLLKLASGDES